MRTVSTTPSKGRTTGARKRKKSRKKGSTTGVTEADLRAMGIVSTKGGTTGARKSGSKKKRRGSKKKSKKRTSSAPVKSGGIVAKKKSRRRRKGGTTGSRSTAIARSASRAVGTAGFSRSRTTGVNLARPQTVTGMAAQGLALGGGAVAANAVGGALSEGAGWFLQHIPGLKNLDTRSPWYKLSWNAVLLYLVANTSKGKPGLLGALSGANLGRFFTANPATGRGQWKEYARYGMVAFFGFTLIYNLIRGGAKMAGVQLDNPTNFFQRVPSYFAGSSGMLSEYTTKGRGVGSVSDLFNRGDYVERLAESIQMLKDQRDDLTIALDGLSGDLTEKEFGLFTAASDYLTSMTTRLELAETEEDLDRASELVQQGLQLGAIAQALLAGMTASAPEQTPATVQQQIAQMQQAQQAGNQMVAQQAQQQIMQATQQAAMQAQQAAQQASMLQQQASMLQQQGAAPAQVAQVQAAAQQAALQAQQAQVAAQQVAMQAQQAQGAATVVELTNGQQIALDSTITVPGEGGEVYEVDVPSAQQVQMQVQLAQGPTVGVSGDVVGQVAAAIASEAGGGAAPPPGLSADDLMAAMLAFYASQMPGYVFGQDQVRGLNAASNGAFTARTGQAFPYGTTGNRTVYGNWGATQGGMTAGGRSGGGTLAVTVGSRVIPCPVSGPGLQQAASSILNELGIQ